MGKNPIDFLSDQWSGYVKSAPSIDGVLFHLRHILCFFYNVTIKEGLYGEKAPNLGLFIILYDLFLRVHVARVGGFIVPGRILYGWGGLCRMP